MKSASPRSRVFSSGGADAPSIVGRTDGRAGLLSPRYQAARKETYFAQCFEVLRELGRGSSAVVHAVRSLDDGKVYAVKQMLDAARGEADLERRLAEVKTVQELGSHPHCIQYFGAWYQHNILYIQTELCEEGSLRDYCISLQGEPVPETELWGFLADLALGLAHMHSRQILHLDLKPANLFLTTSRRLKLGDFGLAGKVGDGTKLQEGDPVYMAPELLQWDGGFGKPADIFSLGITILGIGSEYELPSRGPSWLELREGVVPTVLTRNLSPELTGLVTRMMAPDPNARPTIYDVLAHPHVAAEVKARRRNRLLRFMFLLWAKLMALLSMAWDLLSSLSPVAGARQGAQAAPPETASQPPGTPARRPLDFAESQNSPVIVSPPSGGSDRAGPLSVTVSEPSSEAESPSMNRHWRPLVFEEDAPHQGGDSPSKSVRRRLHRLETDSSTPKSLATMFDDVADHPRSE